MSAQPPKAPKVYWIVVDADFANSSSGDPFFEAFRRRDEAVRKCKKLNAMPGYEPTCRVVKYVRSP